MHTYFDDGFFVGCYVIWLWFDYVEDATDLTAVLILNQIK